LSLAVSFSVNGARRYSRYGESKHRRWGVVLLYARQTMRARVASSAHLFGIGSSDQRDHRNFFECFRHVQTTVWPVIEGASLNMSHNTALRAFRRAQPYFRTTYRHAQPTRCISLTPSTSAPPPPPLANEPPAKTVNKMESLLSNVDSTFNKASYDSFSNMIPGQAPFARNLKDQDWTEDDRHKLHIYAHKHNTHLTLSKPNRDALISVSCGNIGFRKAGRGTYDAGYQLAAFVMSRIQDKGLLPQIKKIELIYRGFGPGREAVTKAILGSEGKRIRGLICKLSDSTRLKFGGVRSKKPRRLG
jgi:small subunit ribosomal protein S11